MFTIEYVYATLLLHAARKEITEENLRKVLEAAGIQVDEVRIKALVAALKEINIDETLKSVSVPMAVAPAAVTQPAQPTESTEKKEEEKKEEKKEGPSEEDLAAGLSALFG